MFISPLVILLLPLLGRKERERENGNAKLCKGAVAIKVCNGLELSQLIANSIFSFLSYCLRRIVAFAVSSTGRQIATVERKPISGAAAVSGTSSSSSSSINFDGDDRSGHTHIAVYDEESNWETPRYVAVFNRPSKSCLGGELTTSSRGSEKVYAGHVLDIAFVSKDSLVVLVRNKSGDVCTESLLALSVSQRAVVSTITVPSESVRPWKSV